SGRTSPAIRLMVVDLPAPERPNSAVIPSSFSKATSRWKLPRASATSTLIMRGLYLLVRDRVDIARARADSGLPFPRWLMVCAERHLWARQDPPIDTLD